MNKRTNRTRRPETLSLSSLNVALTHAKIQVPAQPHIPHRDANEQRALRLIEMMKMQYTKHAHPVHWKDSWVRLRNLHEEMAGSDVR